MREPSIALDPSLVPAPARIALVWAFGMAGCPPTGSPPAYLTELLGRVRAAGESFLAPERKAAVRGMLRHGKYKPSGRSKPSSEYLLAAALEQAAGGGALGAGDSSSAGEFPLVNAPVDANNAVSLEWGYPASVFDLAKTGPELLVRRGLAGESYVFNSSGQEIDLEDLLVVCRRGPGGLWEPCGNPVKDAMAAKVFEDARDVAAAVYAPAAEGADRLISCAEAFRDLLRSECGAAEAGFSILP